MTRVEVRICGLGGQGVVLAGQILGRAAVNDGKNVVQTQSYGAEARGSAAKSEVIISDERIGYPLVRQCDVLVAMNQDALDANIKDLKENAVLIVDEGLVKRIPETSAKIHKLPITQTAKTEMKAEMYANVVMLGAISKITGIVSKEAMEKAVTTSVKRDTAEINLNALKIGLSL
ncbi:MAG: 2-oxoacid:acceptor oxidoreductase family protein [Candidatus Bathyarchaeia archaeon]